MPPSNPIFSSVAIRDTMENFQHEALADSFTQIRLFHMTRNEGIIDCRLIHVQLESRQCPDYCALSYAWGDHALTQPVRINGRWFKITENLYDALSTLSDLHIYSTTWYWVDAICISHSDDLEKGIQVSQMGTIFGQCERVVAWTGPEGDDSEEALDFIQLLSYGYNSVEDLEEWLRRLVRKEEYRFMWSSLDRLLGRPWWRRAWILQECIIPSKVILHCGRRWLDKQTLYDAQSALEVALNTNSFMLLSETPPTNFSLDADMEEYAAHSPQLLLFGNPGYRAAQRIRNFQGWYDSQAKLPLLNFLTYTGGILATDPRDQIFSLLGIADDAHDLVGEADYSQSVGECFASYIESWVRTNCSLDIICYATWPKLLRDLPSWVPDWTYQTTHSHVDAMANASILPETTEEHISAPGTPLVNIQPSTPTSSSFEPWPITSTTYSRPADTIKVYNASKNMRPEVIFSNDLRELSCQGIKIDITAALSSSWDNDQPEVGQNQNATAQNPATLQHIVDAIWRCLILDRFQGASATSQLHDVFLACIEAALTSTLPIPSAFQQWFMRSKSFPIQGRTIEEWCTDALSRERNPVQEHEIHAFALRFAHVHVEMERKIFLTRTGHLGSAPKGAQPGDIVCLLFGCNIPVLLRDRGDYHEFVGEVYLHDFMNGEAVDQLTSGQRHAETFTLR